MREVPYHRDIRVSLLYRDIREAPYLTEISAGRFFGLDIS